MLTDAQIKSALQTVKYPGYSRDIVSFGLVEKIKSGPDSVQVTLRVNSTKPEMASQIKAGCEKVLRELPGVKTVQVEIHSPAAAGPDPWSQQTRLPGIDRIVAIASGKGGVGKSTVAVNLACALSRLGARVGLLDCDLYGPSIPLMMGVHQTPEITGTGKFRPPINHGVRLMSLGFLVEDDTPVIWRGPMIVKVIRQFLTDVDWGPLDYLLVDLPPGTGDAQLTLCQTVPLDGGVMVTTPQEAALSVVRKGIAMFQKVNVPILGLIENMSGWTSPSGERVDLFGHGGGRREAERQHLPFLGEIPLDPAIREGGDNGVPVAVGAQESPAARAFLEIARRLRTRLAPAAPTSPAS